MQIKFCFSIRNPTFSPIFTCCKVIPSEIFKVFKIDFFWEFSKILFENRCKFFMHSFSSNFIFLRSYFSRNILCICILRSFNFASIFEHRSLSTLIVVKLVLEFFNHLWSNLFYTLIC